MSNFSDLLTNPQVAGQQAFGSLNNYGGQGNYTPVTGQTAQTPDFLSGLLSSLQGFGGDTLQGGKDLFNGLGGASGIGDLLKGGSGIFQALNGVKQLNLASDSFDFQKAAYNTNLDAAKKTTNRQIEDTQRSRIASTGNNNANGTYDSLAKHLQKFSV